MFLTIFIDKLFLSGYFCVRLKVFEIFKSKLAIAPELLLYSFISTFFS